MQEKFVQNKVIWQTTRTNSMIQKRQTETIKSDGRQDHGKRNETTVKHITHISTLKTLQ